MASSHARDTAGDSHRAYADPLPNTSSLSSLSDLADILTYNLSALDQLPALHPFHTNSQENISDVLCKTQYTVQGLRKVTHNMCGVLEAVVYELREVKDVLERGRERRTSGEGLGLGLGMRAGWGEGGDRSTPPSPLGNDTALPDTGSPSRVYRPPQFVPGYTHSPFDNPFQAFRERSYSSNDHGFREDLPPRDEMGARKHDQESLQARKWERERDGGPSYESRRASASASVRRTSAISHIPYPPKNSLPLLSQESLTPQLKAYFKDLKNRKNMLEKEVGQLSENERSFTAVASSSLPPVSLPPSAVGLQSVLDDGERHRDHHPPRPSRRASENPSRSRAEVYHPKSKSKAKLSPSDSYHVDTTGKASMSDTDMLDTDGRIDTSPSNRSLTQRARKNKEWRNVRYRQALQDHALEDAQNRSQSPNPEREEVERGLTMEGNEGAREMERADSDYYKKRARI